MKDGRVELAEDVELPEGTEVFVAIPGDEVAIELPADEAAELDAAIDASGIEPSYSVEEVMEELRSERGKAGIGRGTAPSPDR